MAKKRVAPIKSLTLPRLELMTAVMGARLMQHIEYSLSIQNVYLWSDSQIVIYWIQSDKQLNRFKANWVKEIKNQTGDIRWRYCQTDSNPADLQTRGLTGEQYLANDLWHHGPARVDYNRKTLAKMEGKTDIGVHYPSRKLSMRSYRLHQSQLSVCSTFQESAHCSTFCA